MGYRQDAVTKVKVCSPANYPCWSPMVEYCADDRCENKVIVVKNGYMLEAKSGTRRSVSKRTHDHR